ncbi:MAG: endonuclease domain-containing protein [Nitrospirota bacterium]
MDKTDKARELRRNATDAERLLWKRLRMRQAESYKFRRQQPIGEYIVDFVCAERKLIVEVDGGQHIEQAEYDESRHTWLQGQGYCVLRFWNHEVLTMPDAVLTTILQELDKKG